MATYILRTFDRTLAATDYQCIMVKGSHAAGSSIESTDTDINGIGLANVTNPYITRFTVGSTVFTFNFQGICQTVGFESYRLMLAEQEPEDTVEALLKKVADTLETLNDTISAYISATDTRIREARQIASEAKDAVEGIQSDIEDLDERVTALEEA